MQVIKGFVRNTVRKRHNYWAMTTDAAARDDVHHPVVAVQYASDLHMEHVTPDKRGPLLSKLLIPSAPTLVLAGDIGQPCNGTLRAVLEYVQDKWSDVVLVTGNHEYYGKKTVEEVDEAVDALVAPFPNVHLLTWKSPVWCTELEGRKIAFVGCTLWSDVNAKESGLLSSVGDYRWALLTPEVVQAMHRRDKRALHNGIESVKEDHDVVVVTHHMPSLKLIADKWKSAPYTSAFGSSCEWLFPGVTAWIYGHTHEARTTVMDGCLCAVNAAGYPKEATGYHPRALLHL